MARPITWQDVAAPRGAAAAIEVFGRGGDRLAEAVQGMGQVAVDYRNDKIKTATDAAVADLANSEDPVAAAAALPKDWTIDPLAVAVAANARKEQLGQIKVRESTLATNELQRKATQQELDDNAAKQQGALFAQDGLKYIEQTGKMPEFDKDHPLAGTAAGIYAQEAWREAYNSQRSYQLDKERLGVERANAARLARMEQQDRSKQAYIADLNAAALDPKNFNLEPGARAKLSLELAQKHGVGFLAMEGDAHFGNAIKANLPTQAQLDSTDSKGYNRSDVITGFQTEKNNIEADKNVRLSGFKTAQEVALQSAQSEYKGLTEEAMYQKFLDKHQEVTKGSWIGTNWEPKDVGQRADIIQQEARRRGFDIQRHDAVEMVASTIGQFTTGDKDRRIIGDETSAMIDRYGSFAKYGDVENLNLAMNTIQQEAAAKAAKVDRAINLTMRSAVTGEDIDKEVATQFENTPVGKAQALKTELSVLEAALARKSTNLAPGAKVDAAELQRMARRVTSLREQLKKVVPESKP
jgi:hypothetical protein